MIKKILLNFLLIACIFSNSFLSFASGSVEETQALYSEENKRLMDNKLEYDEIYALVKNFNPIIKNDLEKYNKNIEAQAQTLDELDLAKRKLDSSIEAAKAEDKEKEGFYKNQLNILNKAKSDIVKIKKKLEAPISKNNEALRVAIDNLSLVYKKLMLSYKSLQKKELMLQEAVLLNEKILKAAELKKNSGLALQSDVDKANVDLLNARAKLEELKALEDKQKALLINGLGWDKYSDVDIAQIKDIDFSYIDNRSLEEDIKKAQSRNMDLISFRNSRRHASSYANEIAGLKEADIENNIKIDITALYNKIREDKLAYEASGFSYEGAKIKLATADKLKQKNKLAEIEYLQNKLDFMEKESEYESARLKLIADIEEYRLKVGE